MDILENFIIKPHTINRKVKLKHEKNILIAQKNLHQNKEYVAFFDTPSLVVDLLDLRLKEKITPTSLQNFINENNTKHLLIVNFDMAFENIRVQNAIFVTDMSVGIDGYISQELMPFDFEEFIANSKKTANVQVLFDEFFKSGSIPTIVSSGGGAKKMQEYLHLNLTATELDVFCFFSPRSGVIFSAFHAFNMMKTKMKLSKDSFYHSLDLLEKKRYIFRVRHLTKTNQYKFYAFDFALQSAITGQRNFAKTFENMVFLELIKQKKEVYFFDFVDFFLPQEDLAIICLAFGNYETIMLKANAILNKKGLKKILFITIGYEYQTKMKTCTLEARSFHTWALEK